MSRRDGLFQIFGFRDDEWRQSFDVEPWTRLKGSRSACVALGSRLLQVCDDVERNARMAAGKLMRSDNGQQYWPVRGQQSTWIYFLPLTAGSTVLTRYHAAI